MGSSDRKFKTRSLVINMNGVLAYKSLPIKKRYFATPDSTTSSCNANPCSTTMKRHLSRAVPETPKRTSFNYSLEASDNGSFGKKIVIDILLITFGLLLMSRLGLCITDLTQVSKVPKDVWFRECLEDPSSASPQQAVWEIQV